MLSVLLVSPSAFAWVGDDRTEAIEPVIQEKQTGAAAFDLDVLRQRGIDPKLAEYFQHEARFRAGTSIVTLFVNGERRGLVPATFDADGRLCFDRTLRDKASLVTGGSADDASSNATDCHAFQRQFPNTITELRPGKEEIRLIVPTDAFRARTRADTFSRGGVAGLLNYDMLTMDSRHAGGTSAFRSLSTEAGLNVGDWIFRSRQSYTSQNGKERLQHLHAYGQKTLTGLGSTVQGGQINIASSIFPGESIMGVQIVPEDALRADARDNAAVVEGLANTQARVEVRQNHALIYSTVVPPGPFSLTGLPLLNGSSDLEVTVIEADGSRRPFTIPAAALGATAFRTTAGYAFAVGRYRPYGNGNGNSQDKPWVATGTGTWALDKRTHLTAGAMAASRYQAAAWAVNRMVMPGTMAGFRQAVSSATKEGVRGTQVNASLSSVISPAVSASVSATQQTQGYRDLADTVNADLLDTEWTRQRHKSQYTGSVGWTHPDFGGFRLAWSQSSTFDGRNIQRTVGSWVKSFRHATVSLNVERSTGDLGRFNNKSAAYVTVSIPLGSKTVRTSMNRYGDRTRTGATLNERVNDTLSYQVSTERDSREGSNDIDGRLSLQARYAQANVGLSRHGASTTYSGQLQGGIVAHKDGVTFSPYPVQDTFGIISVGGVSGVKIMTPQGPVWTDAWGRAVAPQLLPFHTSRLEIATPSLPRNIDLVNGYQELDAGRGSVNHIRFGVINARRVLLNAIGPAGRPLEKGGAVVTSDGQYVTSVVNGGQIFLSDVRDGANLRVTLSNGDTCKLEFSLPETSDASAYFESANATCTAMGAPQ